MHKKNILFVLPGFTFGGTIFSTLNMLYFLKDMYNVHVLPLRPQGPVREYYNEFNIIEPSFWIKGMVHSSLATEYSLLDKIRLFICKGICKIGNKIYAEFSSYLYNREFNRLNNQYHFDFLASTQENLSTYFVASCQNVKRVAWFRSEYSVYREQLSHSMQVYEQCVYRKFDKIVCVSNTTKEDFCKYFPDLRDRIYAIHNIQNDINIINKSKESIIDPFNKEEFNILSVGRIAKQKQFHLIPSIAYKLRNEYGLKFKWYIIGDGNLDGEGDKLNDQILNYNCSDYVICKGSRLNPYPYIGSASLLVNTSYYEACPRVVAEAKILHIPVVCADFSSAEEFVCDGYDGYVRPISELPSIIARLISDEKLYSEIISNCNAYELDNHRILQQLQIIFS